MSTPNNPRPLGLSWRSSTPFIISTIAIGMFTDLFLYGLLIPILPFLLPARLHTPPSKVQSQTSLLLTSYALSQTLLSLPIGHLSDRLPTRRTPFLIGLLSLLLSTILLYLGQTFPLLLLARALQGMSAAIVWTIGLAMVLETVGSEKLGVTIGSIFGFISVGELVAPVVGGVLYEKCGYGAVFGLGCGLLVVDFGMRLCVIERRTAEAKYGVEFSGLDEEDEEESSSVVGGSDEETPLLIHNANEGESTNALAKPTSEQAEDQDFRISSNPSKMFINYPILYPLTHSRTLAALLLTFMQPLILAIFDATLPLHVESLFGFTSLQSGLLFIPLIGPHLLLGPVCGRLIDTYGPKLPAVLGLFTLIPSLLLLHLPRPSLSQPQNQTLPLIFLTALLLTTSISLSLLGSPGLIEASYVTEQYHKRNRGLFGKQGPYGRLYAVTSMVYSAGLAVGPVAAGALREGVGYRGMNGVVAGLCAGVGGVCWVFLGGKGGGKLGGNGNGNGKGREGEVEGSYSGEVEDE